MRFDVLLLASLPSAIARKLAYAPPAELVTKAVADTQCALPDKYQIQNFIGHTNTTNSTLSSFDFGYVDATTAVSTLCHFNSTSYSTTPPGLEPRYACENGEVKFIWENDKRKLWLIERVCAGEDGKAEYEVSGSALLPLRCEPKGKCFTNSTSHTAVFTSIQPVGDPTVLL